MKFTPVSCLVLTAIILFSCEDKGEEEAPQYDYQIVFNYHGHQLIFTDLPLIFQFDFLPYVEQDDKSYTWSFGDGTVSDSRFVKHVYTEPGAYNVVLKTGDEVLADTTIDVVLKPPVIGTPKIDEIPEFFYQSAGSDYHLLYLHRETPWSLYNVSVSDDFEPIGLRHLTDLGDWDFERAVVSDQGAVLVRPPHVKEIDRTGLLLKQATSPTGEYFTANDIVRTESGYKIVGNENGNVLVWEVDETLETKTLQVIKSLGANANIANVYFEGPDIVRIHQVDNSAQTTNMTVQDLDGNVLSQYSYSINLGETSFKFQGGYLLISQATRFELMSDVQRLSMLDMQGNIVFTTEFMMTYQEVLLEDLRQCQFIDHGDFIYFFFGAMQMVKLTKKGEVLWHKRFANTPDMFRQAILNNEGNFILAGVHPYDPEKQEYDVDYGSKDIMLIAVDQDGNYLPRK